MNNKLYIPKVYLLISTILIFSIILLFFTQRSVEKPKTINTNAFKSTFDESGYYIYGGQSVNIKKWPFMVGIINRPEDFQFIKYDNKEYRHNLPELATCSGTLISPKWILTAAHCILGNKRRPDGLARNFAIAIGFSDLNETIDNINRFVVSIDINEVIVHKNYEYKPGHFAVNDIALLHIDKNIITNKFQELPFYISFISLNSNKNLEKEKTPAMLIGYGVTEISYDNTYLNEVMVPIVSNNRANKRHWYNGDVLSTMIVAGFPLGGKSAGSRDSGGAQLIYDGKKWVQSGIISTGKSHYIPYKPEKSTRISAFLPWIYEHTRKDPINNEPKIFEGEKPIIQNEYNKRLTEFSDDDRLEPNNIKKYIKN